jgi:tetratricopeptide (TPR) repeat protein
MKIRPTDSTAPPWRLLPTHSDRAARVRLGLLLLALALLSCVWATLRHTVRERAAPQPPPQTAPASPDLAAIGKQAAQQHLWMEARDALLEAIQSGQETAENHRLLGLCLGNLGWMEDAIAEYRKAIRLEPSDPDTSISLSTTYRVIGKRAEALQALRQAEAQVQGHAPREAAFRYARAAAPHLEAIAQGYAYLGEFEKALQVAQTAQTADPTRATSYLIAGKCALALHQPQNALAPLRRACMLANENPDVHYTLALALRQQPAPERDAEALEHLRAATARDPRFAPAQAQLGILCAERQQWKEAQRAFMAAYQLDFEENEMLRQAGQAYEKMNDRAKADFLLGQYAQKMGDLPAALKHFRRLSQVPAYHISGSAYAASVLSSMGKYDEAIALLKAAIAREPKPAELYRQIASVYALAHRIQEQIAAIQKASQLEPEKAASDYLVLGMLSFDTGKYDEAENYLEQCVQREPGNGSYQYALGKTYLARPTKGDHLARAIEHLEIAGRLMPENVYVFDYMSVAYLKTQRWQEAAMALRRAIDLAPQNERLYFRLGQMYQRLGKKEQARQILGYYQRLRRYSAQKALLELRTKSAPTSVEAHQALGDLLLSGRDYQGALSAFRRVVALRPADAHAHERLATIYGELAQPEAQAKELRLARASGLRKSVLQ